MKALTLHQPWATLIALGVKTIETRSWRAPASLIGQRIAIHAGKHRLPPGGTAIGGWCIAYDRIADECGEMWRRPAGERVVLPLGAIVATATLTDCLPMVNYTDEAGDHRRCVIDWGHWNHNTPADPQLWMLDRDDDRLSRNVEDQRPYGDFRPGRWAWMLDDITPCDPVLAKGKQGVWEWLP
jgi:activating signal cointegrator 1